VNPIMITMEVAQKYNLVPRDLRRDAPHIRRYAVPRSEAMARIHFECGWTFAAIGRHFGGFTPSSVLRAVQRAQKEQRLGSDGPKPLTLDTVAAKVRDLRRRVEWLEQRAGFFRHEGTAQPRELGGKRGD
jgi:hypothetical protein